MPNAAAHPAGPPAARAAAILITAALLLGASAGPVGAATVTVHIRDTLSPKTLAIRTGTAVRWLNESSNRYRIRSRLGPVEFDSGNLEPGESFTFTFNRAGTYPYLDDREPDDTDFHGTIVVAEAASTPGQGTAAPAPAEPAAPGQAAAPTAATVRMAGRAFSPGGVTIAAGGTVTFVNDDDREHSATATGRSFDTGVLNPGATSRKTFPTPGAFAFLCVIHPEMRGTITVQGAAVAAPPAVPAATPTPPPTPEPTTASSRADIAIADFAFRPGSVDIAVGTTITWRNGGESPHTVTAEDGSFDSGLIGPAGAFSQRFDAPGAFAFVCTFHPEMTGVVRVAQASTSLVSPRASTPDAGAGASSSGEGPVAQVIDAAPAAATDPGGLLRVLLVLGLLGGSVLAFGLLIAGVARPPEERQPRG